MPGYATSTPGAQPWGTSNFNGLHSNTVGADTPAAPRLNYPAGQSRIVNATLRPEVGTGLATGTANNAVVQSSAVAPPAGAGTGTGTAYNAAVQKWTFLQGDSASTGGNTVGVVGLTTQNVTAGTKLVAITECTRSNYPTVISNVTSVVVRVGSGGATIANFTKVASSFSTNGSNIDNDLEVWVCDTPAAMVGTVWPAYEIAATFVPASGGSGECLSCLEVAGLVPGTTVDGTPGGLGGYATALGPPTYATTASGEFLLYAYCDWGSNQAISTPAGYSNPADGFGREISNPSGIIVPAYKNSTGGTETGTFGNQIANQCRNVLMVALPVPVSASPTAGAGTATGTAYNASISTFSPFPGPTVTERGRGTQTTPAISITIPVTTTIAAGTVVTVRVVASNTAAGGAARTLTGIQDSRFNIYYRIGNALNDPAGVDAGVAVYTYYSLLDRGLVPGNAVSVNFAAAPTSSGAVLEEWTGVESTQMPAVDSGVASTSVTASTASGTFNPVAYGDIAVVHTGWMDAASDTFTGDADTLEGSWVSLAQMKATSWHSELQYKATSGLSQQAYQGTLAGAAPSAAVVFRLPARIPPYSGAATGTGTADNPFVPVPWTHIQSTFDARGGATENTAGFTGGVATSRSKIIALCEVTRSGGLGYASTTLSVEVTTDYPGHPGAKVADFTRIAVATSNNGSSVTNEASLWVCDTPEAVVGFQYPDWLVKAIYNATNGGSGQGLLIIEVAGLAVGTIVDGTPGTLSGYASALAAPTYASTAAGEFLLNAYFDWGSNTTITAPAGYSGPDGSGNNSSGVVVAAWKNSTNGTETGTFGGQTANQIRETIMVAFPRRPAGQVGPGFASGTSTSVPWSRRQSWAANFGPTNTASQAFQTVNVLWGSKLFCLVTAANAGGSPSCTSVDDGTGHNFTLIDRIANTDGSTRNMELSLWALDVHAGIVGTKPTITANLINCATSAGSSVTIQEITGLGAADGTPSHNTQFNTGTSASTPAYTSATANEYLMYCLGDDGGVTGSFTYPSGTSPDGMNTDNFVKSVLGYKNSTGGSETGSWTYASTTRLMAQIVIAFRLSNAGANATTISTTGAGTANATNASGTGTAYNPSCTVAASAGAATSTGTANAPSTTVRASVGVATATGTANNASITATASPTAATGTGTAFNTTVTRTGTPNAGLATATGTAFNPTITRTGTPAAGVGTATSAVNNASTTITATASAGTASGTAFNATVVISQSAAATAATGTGTAYNTTITGTDDAPAGSPTGTGTAYNATATASAQTATAHAGLATGSLALHGSYGAAGVTYGSMGSYGGTTFDPTAAVAVSASAATTTSTAYPATITATGTAFPTTATGTGTAYNPTVVTGSNIAAFAGSATATGTAFPTTITATGTAHPTTATGTGTANATTVTVSPTVGAATATGTAYPATVSTSLSAAAGLASDTGTAFAATANVAPVPSTATSTGTAYNPVVVSGADKAVQSGVATATGTANNATITTTAAPNAGLATGTGTAFGATVTVVRAAPASAAVGTGTAYNPTVTSASTAAANAGLATATGVAHQPSITASSFVAAGLATATGVALQASATTASVTNVSAQAAFATGLAYQPTITVSGAAAARLASASGVALNPTITVTAAIGVATATGVALQANATISVNVQPALAIGAGFAPSTMVTVTVSVATATGVAYQPVVVSSAAGIAQIWIVLRIAILKRNQKVSVLETSRQTTIVQENKQKTTVLENRQKLTVEERRNKITVKEGEDVPRT